MQLRVNMYRDNGTQKRSDRNTQADQVEADLRELALQAKVSLLREKFEKGTHSLDQSRSMFYKPIISKPMMELDFQSSPDSVAQGPFNNMTQVTTPESISNSSVRGRRFDGISEEVALHQTDTFIDRFREDLTQNYIDFLGSTSATEVAEEKIETVFNILKEVVAEKIGVLSNIVFASPEYGDAEFSATKPLPKVKNLDLDSLYAQSGQDALQSFSQTISRTELKRREGVLKHENQRREEQRQFAVEDLAKAPSAVPLITDIYIQNQIDADFSEKVHSIKKAYNTMQEMPFFNAEMPEDLYEHQSKDRRRRDLESFYPSNNENFSVTMKQALITRLNEIQSDPRALDEMHRILKALAKISHTAEPNTETENKSEPLSERKLVLFQRLDELSTQYDKNPEAVGKELLKVLSRLAALDERWQKLSTVEQEQQNKQFKELLREFKKAQADHRNAEIDGSLPAHEKLRRSAQLTSISFALDVNKIVKTRKDSAGDLFGFQKISDEEALSKKMGQGGLFLCHDRLQRKNTYRKKS